MFLPTFYHLIIITTLWDKQVRHYNSILILQMKKQDQKCISSPHNGQGQIRSAFSGSAQYSVLPVPLFFLLVGWHSFYQPDAQRRVLCRQLFGFGV